MSRSYLHVIHFGLVALSPCIAASTKAQNTDNQLFQAISSKSTVAVSEALIAGAELLSARDALGRSPLLAARLSGSIELFEFLLVAGADPNAPADKTGNSVLASLTGPGAYPFLKAFVRFGGDVNARLTNVFGETEWYLHAAAKAGGVDLCYAAIQAGAKTDVRDAKGHTVLLAAIEREQFRVAFNLLRWRAIVIDTDLVPDAFEPVLARVPSAESSRLRYWREKFSEELKQQHAQRE